MLKAVFPGPEKIRNVKLLEQKEAVHGVLGHAEGGSGDGHE